MTRNGEFTRHRTENPVSRLVPTVVATSETEIGLDREELSNAKMDGFENKTGLLTLTPLEQSHNTEEPENEKSNGDIQRISTDDAKLLQ